MSITLTTPYVVNINSVPVEDDTVGACVSSAVDYLARTLTYVFKIGTLTGSPPNINVGPYAQTNGQTVTVVVYLLTGQWSLNGVMQGGTIAGSILNPIITTLISDRNNAEGFVSVSGGLMPGSQVPWTQL